MSKVLRVPECMTIEPRIMEAILAWAEKVEDNGEPQDITLTSDFLFSARASGLGDMFTVTYGNGPRAKTLSVAIDDDNDLYTSAN